MAAHPKARLFLGAIVVILAGARTAGTQPAWPGDGPTGASYSRLVEVVRGDSVPRPPTILAGSLDALPRNLQVPGGHREVILEIWEHSPRFRRQLARIASASQLTVRLRFEGAGPVSSRACAATAVRYRHGQPFQADVRIGCSSRIVELIAHELEHVIEQLEGVALSDIARRTPWLVHADGNAFETRRAIEAGRTVAREVEGGARSWRR